MRRRLLCSFLCAMASLGAFPPSARATWPPTGYPLCNVPEDLNVPIGLTGFICAGPAGPCGGALAFYWQDQRSNYGSIYTAGVSDAPPPDPPPVNEATLYLQRPGVQIPGGIADVYPVLCLSQECYPPHVFVWTDGPDTIPSLIRARREFDQEPTANWGADGVIVASGAAAQVEPGVIHDLHGGAIVTWLEVTALHHWVFAQRLDPYGNRLWGDYGVLVGTDTTTQTAPRIAPDGVGGAYLLREDLRGGERTLALFRIGPAGATSPGWPASGLVLGTQPQQFPQPLLRATSSGAWVVWSEVATLSDLSPAPRPFVTLVDSTAAVSPIFTSTGVPIATGLEGDAFADDAAVGPGDDLIVAYEYTQRLPVPLPSVTDLFAARFEVEGSHPLGWPETGLMVCGAPGVQRQGRVLGNGFFAWTDERSGDGDIYALGLREDGTAGSEWPVDGLQVCGVAGTQQDPVIGPNSLGGAFIGFRDGRDGITNAWDLYAQSVTSDARLEVKLPRARAFALSAPQPNPARSSVRLRLELSEARTVRLDVLDVAGRLVHREHVAAAAGTRELTWDLRTDAGVCARAGLYFVNVRSGDATRSTRVVVTQ